MNKKIKVRVNNKKGFMILKGEILEDGFALVKNEDLYDFVHIETGYKCSNYYKSKKEALKEKEEVLKKTKEFIKRNKKYIEQEKEKFKIILNGGELPKEEIPESKELLRAKEKAKEIRKKSKLCVVYDEAMKNFSRENCLLNGSVSSFQTGRPFRYECNVGNYRIGFYSGCKGVEIYKSNSISINYFYFFCGKIPDTFKDIFKHGERDVIRYEELNKEEVVKLVNKNWGKFENVEKNKYNVKFLKLMKKRLIKTLLYNEFIVFDEKRNEYVDKEFFDYYNKK